MYVTHKLYKSSLEYATHTWLGEKNVELDSHWLEWREGLLFGGNYVTSPIQLE